MNLAATPAFHQFQSDDVEIAYHDEGPRAGAPVILIHGFGSNARVNWVQTGWLALLVGEGRRVIALDNRGHGKSGAPHDVASYDMPVKMVGDVLRLMDHLQIEKADLIGYSMGAWIAAYFTLTHQDRVRSVVFSGLAGAMINGLPGQEDIASGLEAESDAEVTSPRAMTYRAFGKRTKSDLKALAACMRASRKPVPPERLAELTVPVLIAVGTKDDVAGSPRELARHIPHAEILIIPDKDHMSAVGDGVHKAGVVGFLGKRGEG